MKSINDGPGQKQGQNNNTSGKTDNKEKARNYRGKDATGPNWNKDSKGSEGDTGQNAGVYK
jgi:hypothetical protein